MTILVRPLELVDAPAAASLHIETYLDTFRGLLPDSQLDALNLKDSLATWRGILSENDPKLSLLCAGAFRGTELIGIAGAGRPRESWGYDSELWAIHIPKRFQKMGGGKALVRASVRHALKLGARNMYLYCVVGNENAMQFYEHLGAVQTDHIKQGKGYQEQALVWNDLQALAQRLG